MWTADSISLGMLPTTTYGYGNVVCSVEISVEFLTPRCRVEVDRRVLEEQKRPQPTSLPCSIPISILISQESKTRLFVFSFCFCGSGGEGGGGRGGCLSNKKNQRNERGQERFGHKTEQQTKIPRCKLHSSPRDLHTNQNVLHLLCQEFIRVYLCRSVHSQHQDSTIAVASCSIVGTLAIGKRTTPHKLPKRSYEIHPAAFVGVLPAALLTDRGRRRPREHLPSLRQKAVRVPR